MNRRMRSLKINAALNGLRQGLNFLYPLITFPYVSRVLSIESVGIYNFSNTYINYFMLLAALGISTYAVREGAKYRDNKIKINKFVNEIFTINILSTLLAYFLLIVTLIIFNNLHVYVLCILIFSIQIMFTTIGTEWVYTIYEDYTYITIRSIIFKLLSIVMLFLFVRQKNDYLAYSFVTVFATVGSNLLNFFHLKTYFSIAIIRKINFKKHIKPILTIFFSTMAVTLYVSSDITILGLFKSNYAVGIYSIATKIYTIIVQLIAAVIIVTIPRLAMLYGLQRKVEYKKILGSLLNLILLIIIPAAIGLILFSKEVVTIIGGTKYLNSSIPLNILAVTMIFSILNTIVSECVLIPSKREKKLFFVNLFVGIFNVIFNIVLIPQWSYIAAACTTFLSESMSLVLNTANSWDILNDILKSQNVYRNIIHSIVGSIGVIIVCLIMKELFFNKVILMLMAIILSALVYVLILIIMHNQIVRTNITKLVEKIK